MKILIADDHAFVRRGLAQILIEEFPDSQIEETSDSADTMDRLCRESWDLVILDIFMPGRGGLDVLQELRQKHSDLPVLVLSSAPEEQMAVRVLKLGANGFLNKETAPKELVNAIRKILAGQRYVSAAIENQILAGLGQNTQQPHERLTTRELAILQRLVAGKSLREIAEELQLSPKTVSTHHTRIWAKLNVQNDIQLVRYAIEHGLLS